MKRIEKIRLLKAIREGKITAENLQPPQVYIFTEKSTNPGVYEYNGKEYNESEYQEFCKRIENKKNGGLKLHSSNQFPKEDIIIVMRNASKKFDDEGGQTLTLKID